MGGGGGGGVDTQLEKLIESLRGKAASFYGRLPVADRKNYARLRKALLDWYGGKEPTNTLRLQLQTMTQTVEEDLEDFAERIQHLALVAYLQARGRTIKNAAIDSFLRGCREKQAGLSAMNPKSE